MFSRGLSGLSWDQDFSWHTGLLQIMTNHIPQLLAKFHQNLMKRFLIMPKKPHFLTLIPYNPRIKIFFKKKRHFLHIIKLQLCAKNRNNPMSSFRDLYRTNERTNGRTNERKLNHKSQPLRGGPNGCDVPCTENLKYLKSVADP